MEKNHAIILTYQNSSFRDKSSSRYSGVIKNLAFGQKKNGFTPSGIPKFVMKPRAQITKELLREIRPFVIDAIVTGPISSPSKIPIFEELFPQRNVPTHGCYIFLDSSKSSEYSSSKCGVNQNAFKFDNWYMCKRSEFEENKCQISECTQYSLLERNKEFQGTRFDPCVAEFETDDSNFNSCQQEAMEIPEEVVVTSLTNNANRQSNDTCLLLNMAGISGKSADMLEISSSSDMMIDTSISSLPPALLETETSSIQEPIVVDRWNFDDPNLFSNAWIKLIENHQSQYMGL